MIKKIKLIHSKFKEVLPYFSITLFMGGMVALLLWAMVTYDKYILWKEGKNYLLDRAAVSLFNIVLFLMIPTYYIIKNKLVKVTIFTGLSVFCYTVICLVLGGIIYHYFLGKPIW